MAPLSSAASRWAWASGRVQGAWAGTCTDAETCVITAWYIVRTRGGAPEVLASINFTDTVRTSSLNFDDDFIAGDTLKFVQKSGADPMYIAGDFVFGYSLTPAA